MSKIGFMKQTLFFIVLVTFLFGCESNILKAEKAETEPNVQLETYDETMVIPNHVAIFEVEGMMCEKGCGATIRKGLYETGGVSKVDILDFNENDSVNKIKVYFDIQKSTTEDMIDIIGHLASSRYSAKLRKVTESTLPRS